MKDEGIEVRATRWSRHALVMLLTLVLLALLSVAAWWVRSSAAGPLSAGELKAVVGEIDAMVRTPGDRVGEFVVHEATPERIARLYRSDQPAQLSQAQRENGLIFAGHGDLLRFEAPSDIVKAIDRWFPQEMANARSAKDVSRSHVVLHGPFATWDDDPVAFMTLWNCMPRRAWLLVDRPPFDPEADRGSGYMGIAARSSDEVDFGRCVRELNGTTADVDPSRMPPDRQPMAARATQLLSDKFARHLAQRACSGTGPDDCAWVAWLWSSLAPADAALATALQKIGPTVLASSAVANPDSEAGRRQRLLQGLRQAAFLRAQLTSLGAAPAAWPAEALPQALRQLAALQTELDQARQDTNRNWSQFELPYYNKPIDPWPLLETVAQQPAGLAALRAQITALPPPRHANCQAYEPWTRRMPPPALAGMALDTWSAGRASPCVQPNWDWLRTDPGPDAKGLRAALLTRLGDAPGQVHEQILSGLTMGGGVCFDDSTRHAAPDEVQAACRGWVSEPPKVDEPLAHTGRRVQTADRYAPVPLPEIPDELQEPHRRVNWFSAKLTSLGAPDADIRALMAAAQRAGQQIVGLRGWRRTDGQQLVVELMMSPEPAAGQALADTVFPFGNEHALWLIAGGKMQLVGIPGRFSFQYDDGSISQVTDIDHDGRPEVWLSGSFGECDGDGESDDPKPGVDCSVTEVHMGEVWGDTLSYFALTPPAAR